MTTKRTPRIVIEDLPDLETLSPEEMERIYGAGRFRPTLEALEDRQLLSASAISNLPVTGQPNVSVQFSLGSNMDLTETKVQTVNNVAKVLGSEKLGSFAGGELFQGHDAAEHEVAYLSGNGHLYEFTPNTGFGSFTQIGLANNNQIIQDKSLDLFFEQANILYEATGVPAAGATGATPLVRDVQAVYQAKDSAGNPAAYTLVGTYLCQLSSSGVQPVAGLTNLSQVVVNGRGQLYALQANVAYVVNGTTATQAVNGVTQMALNAAGTLVMFQGAIGTEYAATAKLTDAYGNSVQTLLGPVTTAAQPVTGISGATVVQFQGGAIYYSAASGAHVLYGAIGAEYAATAKEVDAYGNSVQAILGLPTTDEQAGANGGRVVQFQGGSIYWSATTGAHAVYGAIGSEYVANQAGLGLPTSDEHAAANGSRVVSFQNGSIYWSASTGAHVINGDIGNSWLALGGPSSSLGLPTSNVDTGGHDMLYQNFQNGAIVVPPGYNPIVSPNGPIRTLWAATGFENGPLGTPTSAITQENGVSWQYFQNGAIYWSALTGAKEILNASNPTWSGYAASPGSGVVTAVGGTWVEPKVTGTGATSIWVGIDGWNGSTVEQLGVATSVVNGVTVYTPWIEFYGDQKGTSQGKYYAETPLSQFGSSFTVHPGDTVSASISWIGGASFQFQMMDKPANGGPVENFGTVQTMQYVVPQRSTAEWIVEDPSTLSNNQSVAQPLADFGQVTFTGAWATQYSEYTGGISSQYNVTALNMSPGPWYVSTNTPPLSTNLLGYNEPAASASNFAVGALSSTFTVSQGVE